MFAHMTPKALVMHENGQQMSREKFSPIKERVARACVCCGGQDIERSPAVLMPFIAHRVFDWQPATIDESWGLSTIRSGHAYSLCNSLYCRDCGFLFLDMRFSDDELQRLYTDYRGKAYTELREHYEPGYAARNDVLNTVIDYIPDIENFLGKYLTFPINILDWGGDTGKNTPFRNRSAAFDIYDISGKQPVAGAGLVSRQDLNLKPYDLIVCSNVLEHVPYPSDLLNDIAQTMREQSVLYVEVPFEAVMRQKEVALPQGKRHWHEHINFYSEKSLRCLFDKVGLDILELRPFRAITGGASFHMFQIACKLK